MFLIFRLWNYIFPVDTVKTILLTDITIFILMFGFKVGNAVSGFIRGTRPVLK